MWPTTRSDGSVDVAAQFAPRDAEVRSRLEDAVAEYAQRKAEQDGVNLLDDLSALPTVEDAEADRVRVRFRGRPGARRWKDWLVEFTSGATKIEGLTLEGFFDHVSGELRQTTSA